MPRILFALVTVLVAIDSAEGPWIKRTRYDSRIGNYIRLQIGSGSVTVSGLHHYTITYRYTNAVLPSTVKNKDQLHWNAIGDGWSKPIPPCCYQPFSSYPIVPTTHRNPPTAPNSGDRLDQ